MGVAWGVGVEKGCLTPNRRARVMRLGSQREEPVLMHLSSMRLSIYAMVLLNFVYK